MSGQHTTSAILIVERDSDWGAWLEALRSDADEIAVIFQGPDESAPHFAARARARVDALGKTDNIVSAALLAGKHWEPDVLAARTLLVRAIVTHMAEEGGRVYLDGRADSGSSRYAMQALALVIEDHVGPSIEVCTEMPKGDRSSFAA